MQSQGGLGLGDGSLSHSGSMGTSGKVTSLAWLEQWANDDTERRVSRGKAWMWGAAAGDVDGLGMASQLRTVVMADGLRDLVPCGAAL